MANFLLVEMITKNKTTKLWKQKNYCMHMISFSFDASIFYLSFGAGFSMETKSINVMIDEKKGKTFGKIEDLRYEFENSISCETRAFELWILKVTSLFEHFQGK